MRRLVIRPGAIGDFIVSLPAIESVIPAEVWTASGHAPLVRFAAARAISSTGLDLLGITDPDPRLIETLRGFDEIVSWYGANRREFRELAHSLDLPFRFLDALPPADGKEHAVDFYLRQTAPFGTRHADSVPCIPVSFRARAGAIVHPFSGGARKNWPLDRFREVARALRAEWCAGPEDELAEKAIRIPDLYDLAGRLAGARVFIGNDSGIAHLAAAVGTPVVVLFGPTDPRVWAPRGPCVRVLKGTEMADIPITDVMAAAGALLE
jgi:ADP-heptose:LPS heptosyltransferase